MIASISGFTSPRKKKDRVPKLLEIAHLSKERLDDAEAALEAYGTVLDLSPEQKEALAGLESLVTAIEDPALRLRWLRMELRSTGGEKATKLRLQIAELQRDKLGDESGAVATLQSLVDDTGADGAGFQPLANLLRQEKRFADLVQLLRARAAAASGTIEKLVSLDDALAICHDHLEDQGHAEVREQLYRRVLTLRPKCETSRIGLTRLLRNAGRFDELAEVHCASLEHLEPGQRVPVLYELARIQQKNLDKLDAAEAVWQQVLKTAAAPWQSESALLALAAAALLRGDTSAYVDLRQRQARELPAQDGALVLCHLAEVCEESDDLQHRVVAFYREARRLDPNNTSAMEALKGIGRRLKSLRPAAALLPFDGERALSLSQRAARLRTLGKQTIESDLDAAIDWYRRAITVAPHDEAGWEALAAALERKGDKRGVFRAAQGWVQAFNWNQAIDPKRLNDEAERTYAVAVAARNAGQSDTFDTLVARSYEIHPSHAPSALAKAEALLSHGEVDGAHELLARVLDAEADQLSEEQRSAAYHARGMTLRQLGRTDEAITDLREALHLRPLHGATLIAMGETQAEAGRTAAALEYLIRGLIVTEDSSDRAALRFKIGILWEDGLHAEAEAGACYEQAMAEGLRTTELYHRMLRHFQRSGRLDESLEIVDGLIPASNDPKELAPLWQIKGQVLAAQEGTEEEAIEAFDMALSYDPSLQPARDGLSMVLERRADWPQLLQILEASCDLGSPETRSAALQRMATISGEHLGDAEKAEQYLRASVEAKPTEEALKKLESLYASRTDRVEQAREVMGLLVSFGPPWFDRVIGLAEMLLADNQLWAWTLISPLLGVSQIAPHLKTTVQQMRKEYERPKILTPSAEDYLLLAPSNSDESLASVLAQLEMMVRPLGRDSLETFDGPAPIPVSQQTTLGRSFAALARAVDLGNCTLHRGQQLPENVCVINREGDPLAVIRSDVMQQLVHAEVGFMFAYALCLCRPGHRAMAAMEETERFNLIPALWRAIGYTNRRGDAACEALAERIREGVDDGTRAAWAEELEGRREQDPHEIGRSYWESVQVIARRAGLLAGPDLRQVFRVVSRLASDVPRPRVVAKLEELDQYVASSPILRDLVAFAASPTFGRLLGVATGREVLKRVPERGWHQL